MIDVDYFFEADALRHLCEDGKALTDLDLTEWEMLMRLSVGEVEVLGQSEEHYQRWRDQLKRDNITLDVPSAAWCRVPILSVAMSVEDAFSRLHEDGYAELATIDEPVIRLTQTGDLVTIRVDHDRAGYAPRAELYDVLAAFADRVRDDFLAVCPQLRDHRQLGWWFRGDDPPPPLEPYIIHLPAAKSHRVDWEALGHLLERLHDPQIPLEALLTHLNHDAALIRANVLFAHSARPATDVAITALTHAAWTQENTVRLMGTISVAHVAVAALLRLGTEDARTAAQRLLELWPEPDREDLMWYLKTENLE